MTLFFVLPAWSLVTRHSSLVTCHSVARTLALSRSSFGATLFQLCLCLLDKLQGFDEILLILRKSEIYHAFFCVGLDDTNAPE